LAIFVLKIGFKLIANEASKEQLRQISVLDINNHRSAAVRGGWAPERTQVSVYVLLKALPGDVLILTLLFVMPLEISY